MQDERKFDRFGDTLLRGLPARSADLRGLLTYWNSLRQGGDVPRRAEIDPRHIEPLLSFAFIAERIAPGQARFRIAGTHLSELMGMEVRGMPVSCFVEPANRDILADRLVELFDAPAMVRLSLGAPGGLGKRALTGTLLMLPLRSDLGDVSRAIGCLVTKTPAGRQPRRFAITDACAERLQVPAEAATSVLAPSEADTARGMAEAGRPFDAAAPRHPSERPYLRVVK